MQANQSGKSFATNKAWWLFGFVFIINLIQSCFSPLLNDEPYYWLYSQYLSWGYFDHPPMIALLIKAGSALFANEIGVRLLTATLGSLTFFLLYKIIEDEAEEPVNFKLAAVLLVSSIFLNLYSFLAIPDTPMLFFAVWFMYWYRRYLQADTFVNAALLGIIGALLLYAKYHGILIIGLIIISNPRLFLKPSFYVALLAAIACYLPHMYWQYQNDFRTIRFQFMGRSSAFKIDHVFSYVGEQAAVTGPVILLLFSLLYRAKNQFQKSLKYVVAGVFIFFLLSSFKDMVNVHWTAIAWPAMLCLAYLYIVRLQKYQKLVWGLLLFNLVLVVVLRVNFMFDFFNIPNFNDKNPKLMTSVLKAQSGGKPLVFNNTYNEPAYYAFYSHDPCFAVNDYWYKKTQYDYLPQLSKQFQGKAVTYVSDGPINKSSRELIIPKGKTYYLTDVPEFVSFNDNVHIDVLGTTDFKAAQPAVVQIVIHANLDAVQQKFYKLKHGHLVLTFVDSKTQAPIYYRYDGPLDLSSNEPFNFRFVAPAKGQYKFGLSLVTEGHIGLSFNSDPKNCVVN